MFQEGWLVINGVASHVLTWGGWIENSLPDGDSIILFMCGVPGILLFYQNFLESLYKHLKIPIWTICIAGQELPPESSNLTLPKDSTLYNNVKAQVAHKMAFIKNYVPKNRKIYFIGHSFGAKMVTELLKDEQVNSQAQKCLLLMPTLERFSDTPRAKYWIIMSNTGLVYPLILCSWILSVLPFSWRKMFSQVYFQMRGLHHVNDNCLEAMIQFCDPTVFYNVRSLVWNELHTIKQLDSEVINGSKDKIKVYFAPDDYWAPLSHCETLRSAVPDLKIEILDKRFQHAFTLDCAEDMAEILIKDIATEFKQK